MPRLVRLTTNDSECRFRAKFAEGFSVRPNGQIALKNISLDIDPREFEIDSRNNGITFNVDTANMTDRIAHIAAGTYSITSLDTLYDRMNDAMNYQMSAMDSTNANYSSKEIGLEWRASTDTTTKKTKIEYKVSPALDPGSDFQTTGAVEYDAATKVLAASTGEGAAKYNQYSCKGGFLFSAQIDTLSSAGLGGTPAIVFGLTSVDPDTITTPDISNIEYGIAVFETGVSDDDYGIVNGGVINLDTIETSESAADDNIVIAKVYDVSTGIAYWDLAAYSPSGNTKVALDLIAVPAVAETLYPIILLEDGNGLKNIRYTKSPYISSSAELAQSETVGGFGAMPRQGVISSTNNYLEFESDNLAEILGFNNRRQPLTGTTAAVNWSIGANNIANPGLKGNSLILELENLSLSSRNYQDNSSENGGRFNILATLPQTDNDSQITYIENFPTYLDINNSSEIEVKNLNLRVLDRDKTPVKIQGEAVLTLLFN